jgi:peptidoglycan/LPS O-acetylase OafA/YrhL
MEHNKHRSIASLAQGRDNNLNLMRALAACMVIVSHSYVLTSGITGSEPWQATLGMSPGAMAVDIFFVVSGFLVTGSLLKSQSAWLFTVARVLRIYPGLWVALLLTTLMVGVGFSSLSFGDFMAHPQTWRYVVRNALMVIGGESALPGSFASNPFPDAVNGSLWTLRYELRLYLLLALLWVVSGWLPKSRRRVVWFSGNVLVLAALLMAVYLLQHSRGPIAPFVEMGTMFFAGAAACTVRSRIGLRAEGLTAALLALVAAAGWSPMVFGFAYALLLPYVLFHLACTGGSGGGASSADTTRWATTPTASTSTPSRCSRRSFPSGLACQLGAWPPARCSSRLAWPCCPGMSWSCPP